jgi:hypothetical protein
MGSPYPLHYTLRWPYYYMWPSAKNHTGMNIRPLTHDFVRADKKDYLTLNFCGDIMLTQKDRVPILHPEVQRLINSSDLFIGNCEAPLGAHDLNPEAKYGLIYHMPSLFLSRIMSQTTLPPEQWILSIANNHSGDKGKETFFNSINIMRDMGVTPVGYIDNELPVTILERDGVKMGIASWTHWMNKEVFAASAGPGRYNHIKNADWVNVKKQHGLDLLIGLPHWEYEFQHFPKQQTRKMAAHLIEQLGFNLLVGAHPHTLMPMEWFQQGICAYSLGNFCGLGLAWPVRLIPILEVRVGLRPENKGQLLGYTLHYFVQQNDKHSMQILPLNAVAPNLQTKLLQRLAKVYQGHS